VPRAGVPRVPARTSVAEKEKEKEKEMPVTRILTSIVLTLCFASSALAQTRAEKASARASEKANADEAKSKEMIENAAADPDAKKLPVSFKGNVHADAVLIPAKDARRIFGPEIGNRYAVIEVNVSNRSPDDTLIIHSIFVDYSGWALSGTSPDDGTPPNDAEFQASTIPTQVASEEYRVVRGQFLNAQTWRRRSWALRLLTLAGNVAGAYTFSINEQGFIKGIAAFNGVVVPGINTAWPDTSQDQLNRINDFGFQANKVVAKQSSEIIVCFFPIDRFLTPGFRKLFLKSPSLFFAPGLMLADAIMEKDITKALGDDLGITPSTIGATEGTVTPTLKRYLPCYMRILEDARSGTVPENSKYYDQIKRYEVGTCLPMFGLTEEFDKNGRPTGVIKPVDSNVKDFNLSKNQGFAAFMALDYLSQASLNRVHVTIEGSMTVETTDIPPNIDAVVFDKAGDCDSEKTPCFWSPAVAGGVRTGTISGSYLAGASVAIDAPGVTDVTALSEGSNDKQLRFSFKLTQGIPSGGITFKATKPKPGSATPLASQPWTVPVGYDPPHLSVSKVEKKDATTLTVTGEQFDNTPTYPLVVTLHPPSGSDVTASSVTVKSRTEMEVKIPPEAKTAGCWTLTVKVKDADGLGLTQENNNFNIPPTVKTATLDGDKIVVEGEALNAHDCDGKAPTYSLIHGGVTSPFKPESGSSAAKATFPLPSGVKAKDADATWKVQVKFGGEDVKDSPFKVDVAPQQP
jgi:hypothetical protein